MPHSPPAPVLVTDFDGTITQNDFYRLVIEHRTAPGTPDFWSEYLAGRITHFEALRQTFAAAIPGQTELESLADRMEIDPDLAPSVHRLRQVGWRIVVASAGCAWYIRRLLRSAGVDLEVHCNLGRVEGGRLLMETPDPLAVLLADRGDRQGRSGPPGDSSRRPGRLRRGRAAGPRPGRARRRRPPIRPGPPRRRTDEARPRVPAVRAMVRGRLGVGGAGLRVRVDAEP